MKEAPFLGWVLKGFQILQISPQKLIPVSRKVDGFDWQFVFYSSLYRAQHESWLRALVLDRGGDNFYDVGANVGGWALRATRMFDRVVAFEPHPKTASILQRNIEKNRSKIRQTGCQIRVYPCALGDLDGRMTFYADRKGDRGNGSASLTRMNPGNPFHPRRSFSVEVRRFDDLISDCTSKSVIKIDIEGGEVDVLKGMDKSLRVHHPRLTVEIHSEENVVRCKSALESYGYRIREIRVGGPIHLLAEQQDF